MGGVPILLALAAVTVDYGYQPDGKGGVEYIVQMTPEELEYAKQAGEISSVVDPSVRGRVSRFVVRVGKGKLPRDAGPAPPPGDTVAQAQAFDAAADRAFVPIPEMTASAAAPIPAMPDRAASPVTSAKPQDAPTMSYPSTAPVTAPITEDLRQRGQQLVDQAGQGLQDAANRTIDTMANAAADAVRDPLYRLNGAAPTAAGDNNPYRTTATTNPGGANPANGLVGPPAPTAMTSAPGMQMPNTTPGTATNSPNNAAYGQRDPQRDDQWNREPTASRTAAIAPSTSPRGATASTAAAGNFGTPPPGVNDPRRMVTGTTNDGSNLARTNPYNRPAENPSTAPAYADGEHYGRGAANQPTGYGGGSVAANLQNPTPNPNYQSNPNQAAGQPAAPTYQQPPYGNGNVPPAGYAGGANGAAGQYPPGQYPPNPYPAGQYPPGQYGPAEQLASNNQPGTSAPGYQPPAYPYGPARPASLLPDAENREASNPGSAGRTPGGDEENRGLPQQVFNGLLLLSLVANAYLIIHMSKLIQRYRDLRVNLRTAAAGKPSSSAPAAA